MGHVAVLLLLGTLLLLQSSGDAPPAPAQEPAAAASAPAPGAAPGRPPSAGADLLASRELVVPVQGVPRARLQDTFEARRGMGRRHEAIDIMAPWGTPVLAADDGRVAKISSNRAGGLALYLVDPTGRLVYYYAHLAGYADDLREGQQVRRGEVIAYVGATGNAPKDAPHLHFAVLLLKNERRWWGGEAINPYAALARGDTETALRQTP